MEKETYDRLAAGERLRLKRTLLGLTQEEVAKRINRAPKYYADIERGYCGMSVETLMAISNLTGNFVLTGEECEAFFEAPLAALFYGKSSSEQEKGQHTEEVAVIENMLDSANIQTRKCALDMLKILITASPDP